MGTNGEKNACFFNQTPLQGTTVKKSPVFSTKSENKAKISAETCCSANYVYICIPNATLAQSVEQRIRNAQVVSSSLMSGSKKRLTVSASFFRSYPQSLRDSPQGRRGAYSPDRAVHGHSCLSTGGRIPRTPWVATLRVAPEEGSFYWKVYSLIIAAINACRCLGEWSQRP